MKKYTRVCAKINLDAIEQNIENMHNVINKDTKMIAVLKTDGYGHGAIPIAHRLSEKDYIWGIAVASVDEGISLRHAGITKPILVLGVVFPDQRKIAILNNLRITCYTKDIAKEISDMATEEGITAKLHIKLDTGMSRLGFQINEDSVNDIAEIAGYPSIEMEGMFTHFIKSDELDKSFTYGQMEKYNWMKEKLLEKGVDFKYYHCSNSAGIIDVKDANMDLVRAGISTYGLYPSEEVVKENVPLTPALSLISHVAHVKWVPAGTPVSYGGTYVTTKPTKIVTVPVGYGDGYPRSLSNKGYVLIHGQKAPIRGRVCMDQFMVDVTDIEDVKFGDKITLIGQDGDALIRVEDLSNLSGRFNYEFVCDLSKRIPREFTSGGQVVSQQDCFD